MNVLLDEIWMRCVAGGGFSNRTGGLPRADATAWAIAALRFGGTEPARLEPACKALASNQLDDGRVILSPGHPTVWWPTPLAILAWHRQPAWKARQLRALSFLAGTTGNHFPRTPDAAAGHDTALRGWPWIEGTHSWVEPTSLAMIALRLAGRTGVDRIAEGARMLLDRQLSRGGWNYGNTTVYGTELSPMPESTGLALAALTGLARRQEVAGSLAVLRDALPRLATPMGLGWALLGLAAWGERPNEADVLLDRCLQLQDRHGGYDTPLLSLLLFARKAERGLLHALS